MNKNGIEHKDVPEHRLINARKIAVNSSVHDYRKAEKPQLPDLEPKTPIMKKIIEFIGDALAGENKVGGLLHGLADLLPIPNQVIAKTFKALFSGDFKVAKHESQKVLTTRNVVAVIVSMGYLLGWITLEDVKGLVNALMEIL